MSKGRGVLCHITSLPSGDISSGPRFVDWLSKEGFDVWQILPLTPPDRFGSPYASPSAFAGWPKLNHEKGIGDLSEEGYWLEDWALYSAIKKSQDGLPWYEWPVELRDRYPEALTSWREHISIHIDEQEQFQSSWNNLKEYANLKNIQILGDCPIFVSHDSADVWAHRELFLLDENGLPEFVAGVPPDYFSEDGQRWGTVLYDWSAHEKENWTWWKERIKRMLRLYDNVRIDHFRGFHSSWAIPHNDNHARNGFWQDGPKDKLLEALLECTTAPNQIIAEDLGIIPEDVINLRKRYQLHGMAVLQFGFEGDLMKNPHHPRNIVSDQVVYTGTHDNHTTIGWFEEASNEVKSNLSEMAKEGETPLQTMLRLAQSTNADTCIIPIQDLLGLDSSSRMNAPGTVEGNWQWSFDWTDLLSS
jgi:4-alpha-glucanotransferase